MAKSKYVVYFYTTTKNFYGDFASSKSIIRTAPINVIRSPHIDKNSREQFNQTYRKYYFRNLSAVKVKQLTTKLSYIHGPDRCIIRHKKTIDFESTF